MEALAINVLEQNEPADEAARSRVSVAVSTAEVAECTCPDWCERDHDMD